MTGLTPAGDDDLVSGHASYVCRTTRRRNSEAVGQNLAAVKVGDLGRCVEECQHTVSCAGFTFSHNQRLCFIKVGIIRVDTRRCSSSLFCITFLFCETVGHKMQDRFSTYLKPFPILI